jgi:aspartokinase-like uncharacterized kinase
MWVVKIGGSLERAPELPAWLAALALAAGRAVVVPGGGSLADGVRALDAHWRLPEAVAHVMACLAMEQMGRLFCALEPRLCLAGDWAEIASAGARGQTPVWLPTRLLAGPRSIEGLAGSTAIKAWAQAHPEQEAPGAPPASWAVTSDSLAAWLAARLPAAGLILVKSAPPPRHPVALSALVQDGIVDPHFAQAAAPGRPIYWVGRGDFAGLSAHLDGELGYACAVQADGKWGDPAT